jgi:hypothetical protein
MQNRVMCDRTVIGSTTSNVSLTMQEPKADVDLCIDARNVHIYTEFLFNLIVK